MSKETFCKSPVLKVVAACALAALVVSTAHSAPWDNSQRLKKMTDAYDASAVTSLSGTVLRIYEITPHNSPNYGFHMILKTDQETFNIHLGPGWYLKPLDGKLAVGDQVQVTGSMTKDLMAEGNTKIRALRAAEVRKGTLVVLKLRDKDGKPVWKGF
jgi:hypothetical protein